MSKDQQGAGDQPVRYVVGFDPALADIISEVKYLDQLGFDVPPDAKTVALLEHQYVLRFRRSSRCSKDSMKYWI